MENIKIVRCLSSEGRQKSRDCSECSDSERCATVKPELASLVEKYGRSGVLSELTEEDMSFIQTNYPKVIEFDEEEAFGKKLNGNKVRVAECLFPKEPMYSDKCDGCRDRECCLTRKPELASLVKKHEVSDGIYEFTPEALAFIRERYMALSFFTDGEYYGHITMKDFLIMQYHSCSLFRELFDESMYEKLDNDEYNSAEIQALYEWATKRYDKWAFL